MSIENIKQLLKTKKFQEARLQLHQLLVSNRKDSEALYLLSIIEAELGDSQASLNLLSELLSNEPEHAAAHYTKANILTRLAQHSAALVHHDSSAALLPLNPWVFLNRGISRAALKNFSAAIEDFESAINLNSNFSIAYQNKGNALQEMGRLEDALYCYQKALELDPLSSDTLVNKAACLAKLKLTEDAVVILNRAIELKPNYAETWNNLGNALNDLKQHERAVVSYQRAIELKPDYAEAWNNLGNVLNELKRHEEAVASYQRSIQLKPNYAEALGNLGNALSCLKRYDESINSFKEAIKLEPLKDFRLGHLIHTKMKICEWCGLDILIQNMSEGISQGKKVSAPFPVLGLVDSPLIQKQCSEIYVETNTIIRDKLAPIIMGKKQKKIRIGYFSMDFREHPVSLLIAELIEFHDRNRFEIYGFSFGVASRDAMRDRLEKAFDRFFDVQDLSEIDIARLSREHQIDIAIDLGGHTQDARAKIFSYRAAPIQISYLGYPGTWGSDCIDYFIGDKATITDYNRQYFFEKIIYLPESFQVNPSQRPTSDKKISRQLVGLPDKNFIFCCFNNNWKITPSVFKNWMQILNKVPDSILWLYAENSFATTNLKIEATNEGISANRLIFTKQAPLNEYLDRFKIADLFLDTLPYNAGTTASDALWSGLPVLTQAGTSFVSRMASSLLKNFDLPELITANSEHYQAMAVELAKNPNRLAVIREKINKNRSMISLFDAKLTTKYIESAFQLIFDRYRAGLPPDHIYVDRLSKSA